MIVIVLMAPLNRIVKLAHRKWKEKIVILKGVVNSPGQERKCFRQVSRICYDHLQLWPIFVDVELGLILKDIFNFNGKPNIVH